MKKFLSILALSILYFFISNYSFATSNNLPKTKKMWWCNLYPAYIINDSNDSIYIKKPSPKNKIKLKFKIIELFR